MQNIDIKYQTNELVSHVKTYSQNNVEIYKMLLLKNMTKTISFFLFTFISALVILFLFILLSISLGIFLGDILNSYSLSFFLVACGNLFLLLLSYLLKKYFIENYILRKLTTQIYNHE